MKKNHIIKCKYAWKKTTYTYFVFVLVQEFIILAKIHAMFNAFKIFLQPLQVQPYSIATCYKRLPTCYSQDKHYLRFRSLC